MSEYKRFRDDFEKETGYKWKPWKVFWIVVFVVFVVGIVTAFMGFALGWFNKAAEVVGPQNVEKQYTEVIDKYESLYAAAENACLAGDKDPDDSAPVMVEDAAQAYAATFRKIVVDYNRRMANIFEAGLVGPSGYPDEIPRSLGSDGDWCSVPETLDNLK